MIQQEARRHPVVRNIKGSGKFKELQNRFLSIHSIISAASTFEPLFRFKQPISTATTADPRMWWADDIVHLESGTYNTNEDPTKCFACVYAYCFPFALWFWCRLWCTPVYGRSVHTGSNSLGVYHPRIGQKSESRTPRSPLWWMAISCRPHCDPTWPYVVLYHSKFQGLGYLFPSP